MQFSKRVLLAFTLCCAAASCLAQAGLQIGWNTSGYRLIKSGTHEKRSFNWGLNAGLLYRVGGKTVCVQPTLLYTQKGATNDNNGSTYVSGILHFKNKLNYIELSLPVIAKVPLGIKKCSFDIGAGPYVGSLVSAVSKAVDLDGNSKNTKFKIGNASTDDFKRTDVGISVYMGMRLKHFNMNLGYDKGLKNITPIPNESIRNGCFSINMGAFF